MKVIPLAIDPKTGVAIGITFMTLPSMSNLGKVLLLVTN